MTQQDHGIVPFGELLGSPPLTLPPGVIGIDAGMTLTKIARTTSEGIVLESRETTAPPRANREERDISRIGVTGARVGDVAKDGRAVRVQEIDAAARGVSALLAAEERLGSGEFMMALLGTGTAFAAVRGEKVSHLGGTPLGGGSFTGIARRIAPALSYAAMIASASRGDRRRVDAMISDAYPEGIGPGRPGPDGGASRQRRRLARRRSGRTAEFARGEHRPDSRISRDHREHPAHRAGGRVRASESGAGRFDLIDGGAVRCRRRSGARSRIRRGDRRCAGGGSAGVSISGDGAVGRRRWSEE